MQSQIRTGQEMSPSVHGLSSVEKAVPGFFAGTGPRHAKPFLGRLPLMYVVPQAVHTVVDYAFAAACASTAALAETPRARLAALALAGTAAFVTATSDAKLSAVKLVPIEWLQRFDYLLAASAIATPFVLSRSFGGRSFGRRRRFALGFGRKRRIGKAGLTQVLAGAALVLVSLFTDYRAMKGVGGRAM